MIDMNNDIVRHRVLLVHQFPCVLIGVKTLVEADPALVVVGTVESAKQAETSIESTLPDLVMIGLMLPDMDGFDLIKDIHAHYPTVRTLVLCFREETALMEHAIDSGANGYVSMRSTAAELLHAIRATLSGGVYLEPRIAGKFVGALATETENAPGHLSEREREVITLVAKGFCNKEISGDLGLSIKTIETYRARALEKLGTGSRAQLVQLAMREGWMVAAHELAR